MHALPTRNPAPARAHLGSITTVTETTAPDVALRVLVYSNDASTRVRVISALGTRPHPDLPRLDHVEVATSPAAIAHLDAGGVDLAILDGEAAPTGGLGLAKQLRDELDNCPPILVLIGRADDRWLADWSRADASVAHPIDPLTLRDTVNELLTGSRPHP
ncbi:response regulator [Dietzia aurantiaca]